LGGQLELRAAIAAGLTGPKLIPALYGIELHRQVLVAIVTRADQRGLKAPNALPGEARKSCYLKPM